jgi:hypothetical protein
MFQKEADGGMVWVVDPADPQSTVYRGRDEAELLKNVREGVRAKDAFIRELRSQSITSANADVARELDVAAQRALDASPVEDETKAPDYRDVATAVLKKYEKLGVQPEMLSWGDEQWHQLESEKGSLASLRMAQRVEAVKAEIDQRYAEVNVSILNRKILEDETQAVVEMLAEEGIDPSRDGFDFHKLVREVVAEPKNKLANGVLRNGRVVREAQRVISRISKDKAVRVAQSKNDAEQARSRAARELAGSVETGERPPAPKPAGRTLKTTDDVVDEILREHKFR